MKQKKIGIGIIGASEGGWAVNAHLPALQKLRGRFKVVAVSTTKLISAQKTAAKFGIPNAFDNEFELVEHPDVELVVIAVKVPLHAQLVKTALRSGKMVYCEWPLGNGTTEAEELAEIAAKQGIRTFTGLQARSLPAISFLKKYIAAGHIGEVLSSTIVGTGNSWGLSLPEANLAYLVDPKNGATMMHIPFAHTIDALTYCISNFHEVSATMARRNKEVFIIPDQHNLPQLSDDEVVISGTLTNGPMISVHYSGGESKGLNLYWRIRGKKGEIIITSPVGHLQFGKLHLQVAIEGEELTDLVIPADYASTAGGLAGPDADLSFAIYHAYLAVADDLLHSTHIFPDFNQAVMLHRLLDKFQMAAASGCKEFITPVK